MSRPKLWIFTIVTVASPQSTLLIAANVFQNLILSLPLNGFHHAQEKAEVLTAIYMFLCDLASAHLLAHLMLSQIRFHLCLSPTRRQAPLQARTSQPSLLCLRCLQSHLPHNIHRIHVS